MEPIRACRPSRLGSDEFDKKFQDQRLEKIKFYASRVEKGLPLFTEPKSELKLSKDLIV